MEKDGFLSLDRLELSKYWGEFIKKSVKGNYEASFELIRSKILNDFQLTNAVLMLVKRWDLTDVFESQAFENRRDLSKSFIKKSKFRVFSEFLEFQFDPVAKECYRLRLDFLYKEISARLWLSFHENSFVTELSSLLERFTNKFIQLNRENSNQESLPAILIAKAMEDMSQDWFELDERMNAWINQKLDEIKPELIKFAEKYWEQAVNQKY